MDAAIFGLIVADLIAAADGPAQSAGAGRAGDRSTRSQLTTGGNVCNTGVAMAKLGMKVAAAGLVGKTCWARRSSNACSDRRASTRRRCSSTNEAQTSATVVAVEPGGERCFFHTPGVTTLLDAAAFRRCFPMFKQCQWVQIGYFGLLPALTPHLPELLAELRAKRRTRRSRWTRSTRRRDGNCSSRSSRTSTSSPPAAPKPPRSPAKPTRPRWSRRSARTCRARAHRHQARRRRLLPRRRPAATALVPAYKIDVVDTTGAGDTWFGGLLTGLIKGMPLEQAGQVRQPRRRRLLHGAGRECGGAFVRGDAGADVACESRSAELKCCAPTSSLRTTLRTIIPHVPNPNARQLVRAGAVGQAVHDPRRPVLRAAVIRLDEPDRPALASRPQHAVKDEPRPGDRLTLSFLDGAGDNAVKEADEGQGRQGDGETTRLMADGHLVTCLLVPLSPGPLVLPPAPTTVAARMSPTPDERQIRCRRPSSALASWLLPGSDTCCSDNASGRSPSASRSCCCSSSVC